MRLKIALATTLAGLVFLVSAGFTGWGLSTREPSSKAWEYKRVISDLSEDGMNEFGAEGWELVQVVPQTNFYGAYIFKRAK